MQGTKHGGVEAVFRLELVFGYRLRLTQVPRALK